MLRNIGIALGVSLLTFLIVFVEGKLFDRDYKRADFVKIILLVNAVTFTTLYLLTRLSSSGSLPKVGAPTIIGETRYIPELGEEVLVGGANF